MTPGSSRKRLGRHFKVGGRPPPACQGQPGEYLSYLNDISVAPPITLPTVHEGYPPSAFEPSFPKQQRSCDSAQGSSRKRLGGVIAVLEVILYLELVQYCIHMHSTLCDSRTQVPCISPCTTATWTSSSPFPDGYLDLYGTSSPANWHTHVVLYFLQDGR